ncbi:CHAT domain-containing protein [Truncatella angustata]|uniref:CHAT domain-containing protein n=1 Tax=Truncatella angustata TaxID=152316 RepID=A0A9P9A2I5_9PEZI|nr:CHAT domain-containing protein [Truncatella angustata]KAH6659447.1 CHAT domain-containing protein [Truncatella angustata]
MSLPVDDAARTAVAAAISSSAHWTLLGRFDDAMIALERCQDEDTLICEKIELFRAAARVSVSRGYPLQAKELLEKALELLAQHSPNSGLALKVHVAYVTVVACGQPWTENVVLKQAQDYLDSLEGINNHDSNDIEMQGHLARLSLVRRILYESIDDTSPHIADRLLPLIDGLKKHCRYYDIWKLWAPFYRSSGISAARDWLQDFLATDEIPAPIKGMLLLDLAKISIQLDQVTDAKQALNRAQAAFAKCSHMYGEAEVQRLRLSHGFLPSSNVLSDLIGIVSRFVEDNYPFGVLHAAISPLTAAFNNGDFKTYLLLQEVFHNVCNTAGIHHERIILEIQLAAALNAGTGHLGTVLELTRRLFLECKDNQYWSLAYLTGRVLSLAFLQREMQVESEKVAQEIYELCRAHGLKSLSEAAYNLAIIKYSRKDTVSATRLENCLDIIEFLSPMVDNDVESKDPKLACEKLCLIADIQFEFARLNQEERNSAQQEFKRTISRIREIAQGLKGDEKAMTIGNCEELSVRNLLVQGKLMPNNESEIQAIDLCDKLIELYNNQGMKFHTAMKYHFRSLCRHQIYQKQRDPRILIHIEEDLQKAAELFGAIGSQQQLFLARHALTRIHVEAWSIHRCPSHLVVESLLEFEDAADQLRRELSALGTLEALLMKQGFAASPQLQDLYSWGTLMSLRETDPEMLWVWSQKRKARSLSDMLGLGVVVPQSTKQAILADPQAREIFERFQSLTMSVATTPEGSKLYVRQHIKDMEMEMRRTTVLRDFISLRDGIVVGTSQIQNLREKDSLVNEHRDTVYVDWIINATAIHLVAVRSSGCQMFALPTSISSVMAWLSEHFSTPDKRRVCLQRDSISDPAKPLRAVDFLVAPLQQISKPDDLLVFSPTGVLSSLPLHALKLFHETEDRVVHLIERNPVVYAPSIPVLEACLSRCLHDLAVGRPVFLGQFDVEPESKRIYAQMAELSKSTQGESYCGANVTRDSFPQQVRGARLIHYHGHCKFNTDNALKQSLVLSTPSRHEPHEQEHENHIGRPQVETSDGLFGRSVELSTATKAQISHLAREATDDILLGQDECSAADLTVEDIFKLDLASPLVVLVACDSASQDVAIGDEPMGLIAGLLCAGASTVIGATWPIPSSSGRAFSAAFYRQFRPDAGLIDLAICLQRAVLEIMDDADMSAVYYWGGFCLYGSWLFKM